VSVVTQVYESGQSSGWHSHSGLHAVAVLSGRLAVYDQDCRLQQVEPGQPYVGGQELHLVRNEGTEPATMIVTYLNPAQPAPARAPSPAPPPNCPVP
jgi:quercetin dioxygenase-like cupin family protein